MRLISLTLPKFKNLIGFEISFGPTPITTIVGGNGTGKSNVLEALTIAFRDLDLGERPQFEYDLSWEIKGKVVRVVATPGARSRYSFTVNGKRSNLSELQGKSEPAERLLPEFVFGYYSGPSNRMEEHFLSHQRRFSKALLSGQHRPLRPLFFARPVHAQFVLLAFFLSDDESIRKFLRDYLRITSFESATFVLKEPSWDSSDGDSRFWNARGTVQRLLAQLHDVSLLPLRRRVSVEVGLGKPVQRERLWLFLKDLDSVKEVRRAYESDQDFFKALESTLISDLLDAVKVRVRTLNSEGAMSFRELSEGEQQLLMVLGLLRFTGEDESLLLLDEPDTHLNPAWSVEYRRLLMAYGAGSETSNLILVTHDPLVIADQRREEVRILSRGASGAILAHMPEQDPRGQGVAGLLTSEVYGLESELDPTTRDELWRLRQLAVKDDKTPQEQHEFVHLSRRLRSLDMSFTTRDPLFTNFAREMAKRQADRAGQYVLTDEELRRRREEAAVVLAELAEASE